MSYWTDRQEQLKRAAEKDEAKLKKRLSSFFDAEFKRLEKEIAAYYQQYGQDNVIEYRRLLQSLSSEDRALLMEKMDDFAKKYPQYANLMPVRESIYKLDRLQGLQYSIDMTEAEIAGYTNDQLNTYLTKLSRQGVNYGMEALGFGKNFYSINSDIVKQFVDVPWCNGENFSTRIWNDTQKLARYLNQDIAQGLARGDSYDKLVRQIRQRFDRVNRKDAYRLVFTEGTYVMAESTMQPFKDDFTQYKLSPVHDSRACPICRGLARQVFEISERQPGINFPPIHPWCRCTWEIVVDDWNRWMDEYAGKHSGGTKQAETVAKRMTDNANDGIIKKTGSAHFRKFETGEQVNDFFYYDDPNKKGVLQRKKSRYGQWVKNLPDENKTVIADYSEDAYSDINKYWRKVGDWENINEQKIKYQTEKIDESIATFVLKDNIEVYRGMDSGTIADMFPDAGELVDLIGKTYKDKSFASTSPSLDVAKRFSEQNGQDGIILKLDIPQGTGRGAYLDAISAYGESIVGKDAAEYEFLLKRNAKFEIYDVDESGAIPILKGRWIE